MEKLIESNVISLEYPAWGTGIDKIVKGCVILCIAACFASSCQPHHPTQ